MEQQNPFDKLFDQINSLLSYVKERALDQSGKNITPDIEIRLEKLRKQVVTFVKLSEEIVALSGITDEELKLRLNGVSKEMPPGTQKLLEKGNEIKTEVQKMNDKLEQSLKHLPPSQRMLSITQDASAEKAMDDKEFVKKRRSKFKRFGSDQNWKPL